ncbi:hypothetical protein CT113_10755 [Levilactobacillus brevis]|uniref:hypothetical protein n=1 Tax=Levilactobacillus brevis TaxID=1580 RepID=UPI000413163F|nr:hypothetical protein [Levilactobacillus brevis]ARN93415.1 hypothetical protein AZI11_11190 [Levilactobacillus brevis]ARN96015.1 hypothetical protein AZI12_11225 [Levilactobacillus brevis]ATU70777.1 hypothetical protein CT113_10755 [Levilactobacillus brevis]
MIDKQMWHDWIKQQMEIVSGQTLTKLGSEALQMDKNELDKRLLPERANINSWSPEVMTYVYGTQALDVWGYVISSLELDEMYVAGVVMHNQLKWSELGGEEA